MTGSGPARRRPPLTAVVASRDRPLLLEGALAALATALGPDDRVVVVDSASSDDRVAMAARAAGADLVRCEQPGACRARNAGLRAATTELVAFTDDDCRPRPGWADALADAFTPGDPAFVTGRVLADGGAGRARLTLSVHDADEPADLHAGTDPSTIGHGANMAWRRFALAALGGFDEELGPGTPLRAAEDHDAFWRALRAGATGRYQPTAVVEHHQWRPRRAQLAAYFGYGVGTGALAVKRARLAVPAAGPVAPALVPRRLARLLAAEVVGAGARAAGRAGRAGYQMGVLAEVVKTAGAVDGAVRARARPLRDGHFSAPR